MEAQTRAGIELCGSTLRYAEVEQYGSRFRLLRLGSCDFDFDAEHEAFHTAQHVWTKTIGEALGDVFADSSAAVLNVAIHPTACASFFAPVPVDAPTNTHQSRFEWESALLLGEGQGLQVSYEPVRTELAEQGAPVHWCHVLAVRETVQAQFEHMLDDRLDINLSFKAASQGVYTALERIGKKNSVQTLPHERSFSLAIGWYPTHVQFTLCHNHRWFYSHSTPAAAVSDALYFTLSLLKRLSISPRDVGGVFVYGDNLKLSDFGLFRPIFDAEPQFINPLKALDIDPGGITAAFAAEAYTPCIGVSL